MSRLVQNFLHDPPEKNSYSRFTETGKHRPESYKVLDQVLAIFLFSNEQQVHSLLLLVSYQQRIIHVLILYNIFCLNLQCIVLAPSCHYKNKTKILMGFIKFRWECASILPRVRASPGFAVSIYARNYSLRKLSEEHSFG